MIKCLSFFLVPSRNSNTPLYPQSVASQGTCPQLLILLMFSCRNPTLRECEDETRTSEMETWESSETPKTSEFDCKGQNTSHWGVFHNIKNLSKFRCWKWARMSHLDICSTSYGQKKGRESNWQFDFRPLKVKNQPDPNACKGTATHPWKDLDVSYNFALDLVLIGGLSKEL
jgi:hypothetical protein